MNQYQVPLPSSFYREGSALLGIDGKRLDVAVFLSSSAAARRLAEFLAVLRPELVSLVDHAVGAMNVACWLGPSISEESPKCDRLIERCHEVLVSVQSGQLIDVDTASDWGRAVTCSFGNVLASFAGGINYFLCGFSDGKYWAVEEFVAASHWAYQCRVGSADPRCDFSVFAALLWCSVAVEISELETSEGVLDQAAQSRSVDRMYKLLVGGDISEIHRMAPTVRQ